MVISVGKGAVWCSVITFHPLRQHCYPLSSPRSLAPAVRSQTSKLYAHTLQCHTAFFDQLAMTAGTQGRQSCMGTTASQNWSRQHTRHGRCLPAREQPCSEIQGCPSSCRTDCNTRAACCTCPRSCFTLVHHVLAGQPKTGPPDHRGRPNALHAWASEPLTDVRHSS